MISYQWDDQKYCLNMRDHLISHGYKVWMDIDKMHGSVLETVSEAVENSFCVIMCVSQKYKEIKSCKLEAEYAVQLEKNIVPLIMQHGYQPDGW